MDSPCGSYTAHNYRGSCGETTRHADSSRAQHPRGTSVDVCALLLLCQRVGAGAFAAALLTGWDILAAGKA
jgi:hypothetical protein